MCQQFVNMSIYKSIIWLQQILSETVLLDLSHLRHLPGLPGLPSGTRLGAQLHCTRSFSGRTALSYLSPPFWTSRTAAVLSLMTCPGLPGLDSLARIERITRTPTCPDWIPWNGLNGLPGLRRVPFQSGPIRTRPSSKKSPSKSNPANPAQAGPCHWFGSKTIENQWFFAIIQSARQHLRAIAIRVIRVKILLSNAKFQFVQYVKNE